MALCLSPHASIATPEEHPVKKLPRAGRQRLPMAKTSPCPLRVIKRIITSHDAEGKSTIDPNILEQATPWQKLPAAAMFLAYTTQTAPVDLRDDTDRYKKMLVDPPGLSYGTSLLRIVDIAPGDTSPMHRTQTLDYGIVIEGRLELILDDCTRLLERGDLCVQRATMHAWRNPSNTEWARIAFVLIPSDKPVVEGQDLGENMSEVEGDLKEAFSSQ